MLNKKNETALADWRVTVWARPKTVRSKTGRERPGNPVLVEEWMPSKLQRQRNFVSNTMTLAYTGATLSNACHG
jgi:hypothetical protein